MGAIHFLYSHYKNENHDIISKDDFQGDNNDKSYINNQNNFLNKKTNRKNDNIEESEICNNKIVKQSMGIKKNDIEDKIEQIYNLTFETNQLIKYLINNSIPLKNNSINNEYSFKIISPDIRGIILTPPKGIKNIEFVLKIKNDGIKDWPEDKTYFKIDKESTGFKTNINDIQLGYLKVGEEKEFKIEVNVIGDLAVKKYQLALDFYVGDKKCGKQIYINFQVIEDKKVNNSQK